jgi:N-acyl-D-aspartate/D-glutamate deacylase
VGTRADPVHRTLITGALLVDGNGAPARPADVAIQGGSVAAVAPPGTLSSSGAEVVDGRGHVVCPGFIDIMSHSLWPLMVDGRSLSKLVQGVTTEVMGEGWTPAPFGGRVAEIEPPLPGVPQEWRERIRSWRRFGQWLETMERSGVSPNVASFVGGGTVREYACGLVMGEAGPAEREVMRDASRWVCGMSGSTASRRCGAASTRARWRAASSAGPARAETASPVNQECQALLVHLSVSRDRFVTLCDVPVSAGRRQGSSAVTSRRVAAMIATATTIASTTVDATVPATGVAACGSAWATNARP